MSHQPSRAFQVLGSFEETWVTSLGEAREIMDAVQFDVVLLDLSIPDFQGLETVRGGWRLPGTCRWSC